MSLRKRKSIATKTCVTIVLGGVLGGALISAPSQADTKYVYDQLGRLVVVEYNNDQGTKYFYDAAGNRVATVTDQQNIVDGLTAPPKPVNMINVPLGGMSFIIF